MKKCHLSLATTWVISISLSREKNKVCMHLYVFLKYQDPILITDKASHIGISYVRFELVHFSRNCLHQYIPVFVPYILVRMCRTSVCTTRLNRWLVMVQSPLSTAMYWFPTFLGDPLIQVLYIPRLTSLNFSERVFELVLVATVNNVDVEQNCVLNTRNFC
jgi:hypothetical protein